MTMMMKVIMMMMMVRYSRCEDTGRQADNLSLCAESGTAPGRDIINVQSMRKI